MIFGVFDGLHEGHVHFLNQAAKKCDKLIVVVTLSEVVQEIKKHAPRYSYNERVAALQSYNPDLIIIPSDAEIGSWKVLEHHPDAVFLGYDQQAIAAELEKVNVPFIFLEPHQPNVFKSSKLNQYNAGSMSFAHIFSTALVILFGWGVLWTGWQGIQLFSDPIPPTTHIETIRSNTITPTSIPSSLTILIGGDIMFDRHVRQLGEKNGYGSLFAPIVSFLKKADIVVANLEGPITSNPSKTLFPSGQTGKELVFTFAPETAKVLADAGITIVSLANNHTDNFGTAGFSETKKWLTDASVQYFGDPWNSLSSSLSPNNPSTEKIITKNGISVAFVGYHAFQPGFDRVIAKVKELKTQGNFVIVMPHWGEEYVATSSEQLKIKAHALVASGADAVIGSHPHVIMDHEWIGDVPVFYSLGNLLFDQYFSAEVMKGNIIELLLKKPVSGSASGTAHLERVRVYETSTASKTGVTMNAMPVDF